MMVQPQQVVDLILDKVKSLTEDNVFVKWETNDIDIEDYALPTVAVEYIGVRGSAPKDTALAGFLNRYGEDLIQSFDIIIISSTEEFYSYWEQVRQALIGNTIPGFDVNTTSFSYQQGAKMRCIADRIAHVDRYDIAFPSMFRP